MYVTWKVAVAGNATLNLSWDGEFLSGHSWAFGYWIWRADDFEGTSKNSWETKLWGGNALVHAQGAMFGDSTLSGEGSTMEETCTILRILNPPLYNCDLSDMWVTRDVGPGEWMGLIVVGFDGRFDATLQIAGTGDATVTGRVVGPAFLHSEDEFHGELNIVSENPVGNTHVIRNAALERGVERPYFGLFRGSATSDSGSLELSYTGPDGPHTGKTFYLLQNGRPGQYTFRIDDFTEARGIGGVRVLGAAVEIP